MHWRLPKHIQFAMDQQIQWQYSLSDASAQGVSLGTLLDWAAPIFEGKAPEELMSRYSALAGSPALREAILAFHTSQYRHSKLGLENLLTFSGAQEGVYAVMASLLNPDDEVVVFTPCYPSLSYLPEQFGAKVKLIALSGKHQWQYDLTKLESLINGKTRLIVINQPHNPTGTQLSDAECDAIIAMADKVGAYILSDEVHAHTEINQTCIRGAFMHYPKSITLGVMSKSLGLSGIRIGWAICGTREIQQQLLACKSYLSICTSQFDEYLALAAISHSEEILASNRLQLLKNLVEWETFIKDLKSEHDTQWWQPVAGSLSLWEFKGLDVKAFSRHAKTLLLPASLFGHQEEHIYRIGLGRKNFCEGLSRLADYVRETPKAHF